MNKAQESQLHLRCVIQTPTYNNLDRFTLRLSPIFPIYFFVNEKIMKDPSPCPKNLSRSHQKSSIPKYPNPPICLECGAEFKQFTVRHLSSHEMSQKEYRKKYGFTMRTPLAAKSVTKARSKAAKKKGLPEKLIQYQEARRQNKAGATTQALTEPLTATKPKPMLTPENSIQDDKIICLECGAEFKQLTQTHLSSHGMSPTEYKKKYGFSMRTPLYAKSLTKAAKKRGLPENLKKAMEAKGQGKIEAKTPAETSGPGAQRVKKVRQAFRCHR
jgi:predicted transcriptional regulator